MKNIYQKHHGLPGIPQVSGTDGSDGENGRNIYFGFVNDFFDSIELTVDNIVRYAQDSSYNYYTGLFSIDSGDISNIIDVSDYLAGENASIIDHTLTITNDSSTNIFFDLYASKITPPYNSRYDYSYKNGNKQDNISHLYAKVDTTTNGLSPTTERWNKNHNTSGKLWKIWSTSTNHVTRTEEDILTYPDFTYNGVSKILDLKPSLTGLGNIKGRPLFTTLLSNRNFAYFAPTELLKDSILDTSVWRDSGYSYNDRLYTEFSAPYSTAAQRPIENIISLYLESSQNKHGDVDYVKYARKAVDTVPVSDRLNSNIKEGDVIYFYTNKDMFEIDNVVEYMVVITKELERCTLSELIENATIANPLSFKYVFSHDYNGDSYLETNSKISSVYVKSYDGAPDDPYNSKNFANAISNSADSIVNLGILENTDTMTTVALKTIDTSLSFGARFKETVDSSVEPVNLISTAKSDGKSVLKISNLCVKKHNIGNIETIDCLLDTNIKFTSDGFCYTLEEDDFNPITKSFTIHNDKVFNTSDTSSYMTGATVITFDKTAVNLKDNTTVIPFANFYNYSKITYYVDRTDIPLTETFGENTAHIVMMWVTALDGIKHCSRQTYAEYNIEKKGYDISVLEYNGSEFEESDNIINDPDTLFVCDGLSANETSCQFDIYVPNTAKNVKVFVNTRQVYENVNYSNSWFECIYNNSEIVESGDYKNMLKISTTVNTKNNIPQISSNEQITSASQLYANPGASNEVYGCDLFNMLLNGQVISTPERSVNITVKYTNGTKQKSAFYKLTQPGFKDNRKMPTVNLTLNKDLESLENSNKIENGVLCNQFQFFVDIDIDDFSSDIWGSFVPEENISLNIDIANIPIDYDFVNKYGIQAAIETYSLTGWPVSVNDLKPKFNFVSMVPYLVNNDISDPYGKTQKELEKSHNEATVGSNQTIFTYKCTSLDNNSIYNQSDIDTQDPINVPAEIDVSTNSVLITPRDFGVYIKDTDDSGNYYCYLKRNTGVQCNQIIKLRDIHFSDIQNGKYRFRVVTEIGNPFFSRLFFRYYVANMWVSYKINDDDIRNFYVGTYNLAKINTIGRYQTYDYMFATKTLNAFVCPISLTACQYDETIEKIKDKSRLSGSDKQLNLKVNTYVPDVNMVPKEGHISDGQMTRYDEMSDDKKISYIINNQSIPWFEFSLKKRYFQDNVKNLTIQPIHYANIKDKICDNFIDELVSKYPDWFSSTSNKDTYLSVLYNANMYNQNRQMRNDIYTFFYNGEELESERYSQYANNAPVFLREDITHNIRSDEIISSMYDWNFEYELYGNKTDSVFNGHLSTYGNGYNYLSEESDMGQYSLSLENLKSYNENTIEFPYERNISVPADSSKFTPKLGYWFRTLLYQIKWQYPRYYTDENQKEKVDALDIVSNGAFRAMNRNYVEKRYEVPHNVTYSIYPRCAYDDEHDTAIIFMLRCPSIVNENKYYLESPDILINHIESDYTQYQLKNFDLNVL